MISCPAEDCESVVGPDFAELFLAQDVMERLNMILLLLLLLLLL